MKIWIFNHYAQDDDLPGGTRHYDIAKQLVSNGHDVIIFAAGFHYTLLKETVNYNSQGYNIKDKNNVKFIRVKTFPYSRNDYKRMINIMSYYWKLNFLIPKLKLAKPDIIIGTTVHPFAPLIAYKFAKKYGVPFIFEIRDLWPQSFIDMGVWKKNSLVVKLFKFIEKYTVDKSNVIISLSPKTEQYLIDEYGFTNNIYLPNGVDIDYADKVKDCFVENNETFNKLKCLKSNGKKLYMYTGAIVQSNNIHMFIEIAEKLKIEEIQLVLVGKGQEREKFKKIVKEKNLNNISFLEPVNKKLVPKLLNYADVLLLVQGNVQWGSSNKLFDYLAARKPIITSLYAKHNNIVEDIECGYSSKYNDSDDMLNKIMLIHNLTDSEKSYMGNNAYEYVRKNHNIKLIAGRLESVCQELIRRA